MLRRRDALRILASAPFALALGGCKKRGDEIRIGAYLSLSGEDASFGNDTLKGIDLATEQANLAGGLRGHKVKIYTEDDQSRAGYVSEKIQQLVDREGCLALLGEVASSRTMIGSLLAEQKRIPMITPSSTAVEITEEREYTFRACFTDAQQGTVAARFARENLKKTRAAIFYTAQDPYAAGLAQVIRGAFTKMGGTITLEKGYPAKETNFATYLQAIKASDPEVIFAPIYYNQMIPIARQARTIGIPGASFIGTDGWDSSELLDVKDELEGAFFTNHYAPDVPWPSSQAFIKSFHARYGEAPNSLSAQGFDAARLLFDAIARATALTSEAVKVAISETKGFQGATGVLTIGKDHNANKPIVIVQIRDGDYHYFSELQAP